MFTRKLFWLPILAALLALVDFGCSTTQKADSPAAAAPAFEQYHDIVDVDYVMEQVQVPMPEGVMIIDARPKRSKYDKGHIPMAVSIPDSRFDKMTDLLPKDKNALLVFYCGGLKCPLSHKSAFKAEALGYTNIKVFAAGFPAWMAVEGNYAAVSTDWVQQQIEKKSEMVLVDSRPKRAKYDKGHITGAVSLPDSQFDKLKDQLPADKDRQLVFYCGGLKCPLSHKSAKKALELGYTNVKVFADGYPAWKAAYGDKASTVADVKSGEMEGSIDIATFKQMVEETPESIMLIDVRDPAEYQAGSFKTAVNMPVDKLEDQIGSLPTDKPVVFICNTGARSGEAFYMVQDLRPEMKNVYYLEAELTIKKDGSYEIKKPAS